ncbi:MAG: hypothetical protein ACI4II_01730 [Acutalibacteraceae bacterium]
MKPKAYKIMAAATFCTTVILLIISISFNNAVKQKEPAVEVNNNVQSEKQIYKYIVKTYHGKLAVFEPDKEIPFKVTNLDVNILPQSDRILLDTGIGAVDNKELNRILEDFCS